MTYFNKQLNQILNENIDLIVSGITDIMSSLGFGYLIDKFDCDDSKAFHDLEDKVLELKLQRKYRQAEKIELFLKKKRVQCFNSRSN